MAKSRQDINRDYQASEKGKKAHNKAHRTWAENYRGRVRELVIAFKVLHPCSICGESRIPCLDFHHVKGKKEACISTMVSDKVSLEKIRIEMDKCIVVCANCHRMIHAN